MMELDEAGKRTRALLEEAVKASDKYALSGKAGQWGYLHYDSLAGLIAAELVKTANLRVTVGDSKTRRDKLSAFCTSEDGGPKWPGMAELLAWCEEEIGVALEVDRRRIITLIREEGG